MHKVLWDFKMLMDNLIPARRIELVITKKKKKKTCCQVDLAVPADYRCKTKENEKRDKYLETSPEN